MCSNQDESKRNCLTNILDTILCLQEKKETCLEDGGCDKPYLGPTPSLVCYNTRPINLYNCMNGTLWTFPYTLDGTSGTSSIFRVENMDGNCCTCRVLAPNPVTTTDEPYVATSSFFTINLDCVSAIKCLADTFVSGV